MNHLDLPSFSLIVLVGPSGAGKHAFADQHFAPDEIVSCRAHRGADAKAPPKTPLPFPLLAERPLANRRLTVLVATHLEPHDRQALRVLAKRHHVESVAVILDPGRRACERANAAKGPNALSPRELRRARERFERCRAELERSTTHHVYRLHDAGAIAGATVVRRPVATDRRGLTGGFDLVGDVHGSRNALVALMSALGYEVRFATRNTHRTCTVTAPRGRTLVLLGDLVDRGPASADVLRIAMHMTENRSALAVLGNHDDKLLRYLKGRRVTVAHGLATTLAELDREPPRFRAAVRAFIDSLQSHYWLDDGKLCAAHAAMREDLIGRTSKKVHAYGLYGEPTGERDEARFPVRADWAQRYRGPVLIVHGHTVVEKPAWRNRTLGIDTGAVFGGRLSALRYPEMEIVSVPASSPHTAPV